MPLLRTLDAFAPAVAIGQFFGWLGCFFSGFCRQQPSHPAWDAHTILNNADAVARAHLYPFALFIAAGHFVIFGLLLYFKQKRRFNGQSFWLYVLLFGMLGLATAVFFQAQTAGMFPGRMATMIINTALVVVAGVALLILRRRGVKAAIRQRRSTDQCERGSFTRC